MIVVVALSVGATSSCGCDADCAGAELLIAVPNEAVEAIEICEGTTCSRVEVDETSAMQSQQERAVLVVLSDPDADRVDGVTVRALAADGGLIAEDEVKGDLPDGVCGCLEPFFVMVDESISFPL